MDYDTAQLVVPLMDFVARWGFFNIRNREEARDYLAMAGFEPAEMAAVVTFLDALDVANEGSGTS